MNEQLPLASFIDQVLSGIQHFTDFPPEHETQELYSDFPPEYIQIFAKLHETFITALREMNDRIRRSNSHYKAEDSRILKSAIEGAFNLEDRFTSDGIFPFRIIPLYKEHFKTCLTFLELTGGSGIPSTLKPIPLYTRNPIFEKLDIQVIPHHAERIRTGLKYLGDGGFATTYTFKDTFLNKKFVLKRAHRDLDKKDLIRFRNEFETLSKLSSPYIIEVYSYNEETNEYIMEKMDQNLYKYISKFNSTIDLSTRKKICLQLLQGLRYLHSKKLLHRDIHEGNVLLKFFDDGTIVVKLADFGLAKVPEISLTSIDTSMKGLSYNDPNLKIIGFSNYSMPHEIYTTCSVIHFILTGKKLGTDSWNISKIKNEVLRDFVAKGMSSIVEERYKNIEEVEQATREVIKSMERTS